MRTSFSSKSVGVRCEVSVIQGIELFAPEILKKSKRHRDGIKWQLDESLIPELSHFAHNRSCLVAPFILMLSKY